MPLMDIMEQAKDITLYVLDVERRDGHKQEDMPIIVLNII